MSKREQSSNIIYISGRFLDRVDDITDAFKHHDIVELRAKDIFIELAIQLAEHFIKKGWASYEQFRSSLTTNQDGQTIPQILIKLIYVPADSSSPAKEKTPERKEYRQRERDYNENNGKYEERPEGRGKGSRPYNNYRD